VETQAGPLAEHVRERRDGEVVELVHDEIDRPLPLRPFLQCRPELREEDRAEEASGHRPQRSLREVQQEKLAVEQLFELDRVVPLAERLAQDRIRRDLADLVERGDGELVVQLREMDPERLLQQTSLGQQLQVLQRRLVRQDRVRVDETRSFHGEETLEEGPQDEVGAASHAVLAPRVLDRLEDVAGELLGPALELRVRHPATVGQLEEIHRDRRQLLPIPLQRWMGWVDLHCVGRY